ncbi:unnamed protein product [Effrenium voratum]|nr:unnamed protein product [Effrenium voratum]
MANSGFLGPARTTSFRGLKGRTWTRQLSGSDTHWPDGTPKRFRGKEAWKNWINWDAPFRDQSDELNRQRKFFWEVDDKGALWRLELNQQGRFGQMRHLRVVDDFLGHLQRNRTGSFEDFPFVSLKTHEHYYLRWASSLPRAKREAPIVFNDLQEGQLVHLIAGELAKSVSTAFDVAGLRMTSDGRLLHPVFTLRRQEQSDGAIVKARECFLASIDVATSQYLLSHAEVVAWHHQSKDGRVA